MIINQVHTVLDVFLLSINALYVSETHQDKCLHISLQMWVREKECTVGAITRGSEPEVTALEADIFISTTKHSH